MPSMDDAPSMALIVRRDLAMSAGKMAVQCAHAAVTCTRRARQHGRLYDRWLESGARKVCLAADDEVHLNELLAMAETHHVVHALITDAGHTELPPGTVTVLGLGPAPRRTLDAITGSLASW